MEALLELRGITKAFPGVVALSHVDFDLRKGEVHALIGENGAGKSTLIKIGSGVLPADAGEIFLEGRPVSIPNPRVARALGIAAIHQERALFPDLSVLENLFMGRQPHRFGLLHWRRMREEAHRVLEILQVSLDLDIPAGHLSAAQQQIVEIARALLQEARVLIMDEPTAPLTQRDVHILFQIVRQLKSRGVGIIYISHRLEEVFEVADRVTVLRDGYRILTADVSSVTREDLIRAMVGRVLDTLFPKEPSGIGPPVLEVRNLTKLPVLRDVSFTVHRGEIVGLGGLVGSGRTTLAQAVFGVSPPDSGDILVDGARVTIRSPAEAARLGLAYIPEDRQQHGLVLPFPVGENLSLAILHRIARWGFVQPDEEEFLAKGLIAQLDIRPPSSRIAASALSGGNQQKVVVGKWLATKPKVLLMDEPTRGIDVGAKAEIHRLMSALAREGMGILLISSELPELLGMCDRILVMHRGRIVGSLVRGEATQERVMALATGIVSV
jgi:ABC-type sugar transport system ATPase subunit